MTFAITDSAVIKELGFEANTKYANAAYRRGVAVSWLILLDILAKTWWRPHQVADEICWVNSDRDLAFCMFKNERDAIEAHIANAGVTWKVIFLDLKKLKGLEFRRVFAGSFVRLPKFLFFLTRHYGLGALRTFAHPFIGYLVYRYLRDRLRQLHPSRVIVTANISHPVSLGVHYAALSAQLPTLYIEHAMTPRLIARDRSYGRYLVRSPHTRLLLAESGVRLDCIHVLPYWHCVEEAPPVKTNCVKTVGIAVNELDAFDSVIELVIYLNDCGLTCLIRVHDADRRMAKFKRFGEVAHVEISSAATSAIFDFLRRCDIVLAGNSSVLLDCYRARVPVIYYWSGEPELFDYYGIVQHTSCPSARNTVELCKLLAAVRRSA